MRYLINGKSRDTSETRTPGIALHEKIRIQEWFPTNCQVQLNVWDFGGQEMLRGTHRFFLTERSLYLLVLEDRRQDDRSVYEWMKVIRNRGADSPVIIVINKSDEGKQDLRLDQDTLQKDYPNIVRFLRTSCDPGTWAANSIRALRAEIVACITDDHRLRHGTDPIPDGWLAIKHQITTLAEQRSVLAHADFRHFCEHPGSDVEPVTDEYEQRALLELLHQLGTIIAHGLERGASAARREVSLLDPNWLTTAVYRILEQARAADQQGEFLRSQLSGWLDPGAYPADRHEFILDMMQDSEIGLCFRVPGTREERYLVPEALSESRPYVGKLIEDAPVFRFRYNYLPSGLIPRLIVQSHHYLPPDMPRWRSGVMLKTSQCHVLVLADLEPPGKIDLRVEGPEGLRRAALNVVLNDLEAVHALNPEALPDPRVPIPGQPEKDVGYQYLLELEERYEADRSHPFEGASREYTVRELLEGVRRDHITSQHRHVAERSPEVPQAPHVVVLIHGIRTAGLWQSIVRRSLEREGFRVQLTNYGIFNIGRFLFPGSMFRRRVIDEMGRQIRHTARDAAGGRCSIIAHSFGTYVIARILAEHTDLRFRRVIFCGSVVPHTFRFEDHRSQFDGEIINEVGTRDVLPVLAETSTLGYGSGGTYGFRRPGVRDRWHNGKAHSDFLIDAFCTRFWAPYLRDGTIAEDDSRPERPPGWIALVRVVQPRFVVIILGALLLWWVFQRQSP